MSIHAHGGHVWVRMDVGEYKCGLGHGKEAKRVTRGPVSSRGYMPTVKRKQKKMIRCGGVGIVSGDKTRDTWYVLGHTIPI